MVRKIPWRKKLQPSPVFLPGKSHEQRSLAGYHPWCHKRVKHNLATAAAAVASVMSDSVRPHRQQLIRLRRPWDSPGKNTGVGCHFLLQRTKVKSEREVAQSCPTLSDPIDYSPPGSSAHGIFQARVLEWVANHNNPRQRDQQA